MPTTRSRTLRWIPAIAIPAVVIAGAVTIPAMANADVALPSKSAAGIVALAEKSVGTSFTGTIEQSANLGLPDLSALGGQTGGDSGGSSPLAELTGTHKARVFVDGTTKSRIQTLDQLAERDLVRNGTSVWAYDSNDKAAVHLTLPSKSSATPPTTATPTDPSTAAAEALEAIGTYTDISTADNVRVAGQKAYQVTLAPNDSKSLVGAVTLAVDAKTGVPLRVQVTAAGQSTPAFSVAFTKIRYQTPAAATFDFTPPEGATVKKIAAPASGHLMHPGVGSRAVGIERAEARPIVLGSGWSTVVGMKLPASAVSQLAGDSTLGQVFKKVDGGRVLQTALVSVLITDDGEVYVGAVTASALQSAVAAR